MLFHSAYILDKPNIRRHEYYFINILTREANDDLHDMSKTVPIPAKGPDIGSIIKMAEDDKS